MFHPLHEQLTRGVELPRRFTNPFDYLPHPLIEVAREQLCGYLHEQQQWHAEINQGKMFGVLVVENRQGELGFLAAFSGYLDKQTLHPYFVPPIVNLLDANGFFALEEANISEINRQIKAIDKSPEVVELQGRIDQIKQHESAAIELMRTEYLASRARRREMRSAGCTEDQHANLNAESQRQKGALRRRELNMREQLQPLLALLQQYLTKRKELASERQNRSSALQNLTFSRFAPLNALGQRRSLLQIFEEYNHTTPPAGSGECAAPKLLHYAYVNSLKPIAMGEFWWGESTRGQVRRHMNYYPACRGKCHPILSYMLQGLEIDEPATPPQDVSIIDRLSIIYEDEHMVAFNKPSGLASVRGLNHEHSVQSIVQQRYPDVNPNNLIVHRLDMDTSGVLVIAKSAQVQTSLQQQFASHTIRKRYIALVDGIVENDSGTIDLPLALDPFDRPRQRVDFEHGKPAYTAYSLLGREGAASRLALYPQTGRTHQLRVHCAHLSGLNMPIVGDRLYGSPSTRLMLHAEQITLQHPVTGRKFTLRSPVEF